MSSDMSCFRALPQRMSLTSALNSDTPDCSLLTSHYGPCCQQVSLTSVMNNDPV